MQVNPLWDHSGSIIGFEACMLVQSELSMSVTMKFVFVWLWWGDFFHYFFCGFVYCPQFLNNTVTDMHLISQRPPRVCLFAPLTCNIVPYCHFFILHMTHDQNIDFMICTSLITVSHLYLQLNFTSICFACQGYWIG